MAITVVQVANASTSSNFSAQPVFGATCTVGNTWYAISSGRTANMNSNPSTSDGGWTRLGGAADASGNGEQTEVWSLACTATTTPPKIQSGTFNSDRNVVGIFEVSGGGSGVTTDQIVAGNVAAAGGTTSNLTTGAANTLALIGSAAVFENPAITGGGWSLDWHALGTDKIEGGHQAVASSGATVNATIAASGFANTGYVMITLKGAGATESGAVTMAFSGISMSASGSDADEAAAVAMAFGGIAIKVNVVDVTAEPTLVNFYVF